MGACCIVHPTDFSETAQAAEAEAIRMARALGAELLVVHAAVDPMRYADLAGVMEAQREWALRAVDARVTAARAAGIAARGVVRTGPAADVIVRTAEAESAAMIVMGTHGRGALGRFLIGSVADRVLRTATCPVLTVRAAAADAQAA